MTSKIYGSNDFDEWAKSFTKVSFTSEPGLHIWKWEEIEGESDHIEGDELARRIKKKIGFLKGYFDDISSDGDFDDISSDGDFFIDEKHWTALPDQYPSRCNNAYGFWILSHDMFEIDSTSFHFLDDQIVLFAPTPRTFDWLSIQNVMPFDTAFVRLPEGQVWTHQNILEVAAIIQSEFDGYEDNRKIIGKFYSPEFAQFDVRNGDVDFDEDEMEDEQSSKHKEKPSRSRKARVVPLRPQ